MPYFNREFPVLGGGNSGERPPPQSEEKDHSPYGPRPMMRNMRKHFLHLLLLIFTKNLELFPFSFQTARWSTLHVSFKKAIWRWHHFTATTRCLQGFASRACYVQNLPEITKLKFERKNKLNSRLGSKRRHHVCGWLLGKGEGLFWSRVVLVFFRDYSDWV